MTEKEALADVLFEHSDSRPCRMLWKSVEQDADPPDVPELVEVMRATGGEVALVATDPMVDVYARWGSGSGFEHLSISPPWNIVEYDRRDRSSLVEKLETEEPVRPVLHDRTPFTSGALELDNHLF